MQKLTAQELKERLDRGEDTHVINVLPEEHFREKHIPGSVSIPLTKESFLHRTESLVVDKDAPVVVYCADAACNASPEAAARLEQAGFRKVVHFPGGVREWEEAGYPLEGQAARA